MYKRQVIYYIETYDVTTVRASTPMYLLARVIKSMGIKMVLSLSLIHIFYVIRKKIEKRVRHKDFYIVSLSGKNIIYKGMLSSIEIVDEDQSNKIITKHSAIRAQKKK